MNSPDPHDPNDPPPHEEENATPLQHAIRQRAIDMAQQAEAHTKKPHSRWLFGAGLMVCVVLLFLFTLDVSVRVMHTIIDILIPDQPAPAEVDPKQPYFISVDPGQESSSSDSAQASSK